MPFNLYAKDGRPFAYSEDSVVIYTFEGKPVAYLKGLAVYAMSGRHLGYFEKGHLRDHSGCVVLFSEGSTGGPIKPIKGIHPIKGIKQIMSIKGICEILTLKAIPSESWSDQSPEKLFRA